MAIALTFSLVLTILILYRYENLRKFRKKFKLPGPFFYPLVGVLPELMKLKKLTGPEASKFIKKKYGDIAGFLAGSQTLVFMNDYSLYKEVLNSPKFTGRIPTHSVTFTNYYNDNLGLIFSHGKSSKEIRSFTIKTMRNIKFGQKNKMNEILSREVVNFNNSVDNHLDTNGPMVCIFHEIGKSVFKTFWGYMAGSYEVSDEEQKRVCDALFIQDELTELGKSVEWFLPKLRNLSFISEYPKLEKSHKVIKSFFKKVFQHTKDEGVYRDDPRNVIDYFMKEIEDNPNKELYHEKQMQMVCNDLLIAGLVTTTNTITWTLYNIMRTPRVYAKLMKEIKDVIGDRLPDLESDRERMPYLEACIQEGIRKDVAVALTARMANEPIELNGFHIPGNTMIIIDMDGINQCPKLWKDPHVFRPERFLDEEMKPIRHEHFMPFGIARRACLGEKLARASAFFHLINFFQNYDFIVPDEVKHLNGISNNIEPFSAYLTKRKEICRHIPSVEKPFDDYVFA